MVANNMISTLASCVLFVAIVAWVSNQKTQGDADICDGYFLAGRGLTGISIAGAILLTKLSVEQLIGLDGPAYGFNLSSMACEIRPRNGLRCVTLVKLVTRCGDDPMFHWSGRKT